MINGKSVVAIIPARGGSKGLPGKNIRQICGKPLISWSIKQAIASKFVDVTVVTSDCPEIIGVAKKFGAQVPFIRPKKLAADDSSTMDVIVHAHDYFLKSLGIKYEYSVTAIGELSEGKMIYKGEIFHIERPSGTVLGGGLGNRFYPTKIIIDPGSKEQNFKLLYLSNPVKGTENGKNAVYIEVKEYAKTYEKPFVAVTNTKVLSGICI